MKNWLSKINVAQIMDALLPVFATFAALAVGAVMLLVLGANPIQAYGALLEARLAAETRWPKRQSRLSPCCWLAWASASPFERMSSTSGARGR